MVLRDEIKIMKAEEKSEGRGRHNTSRRRTVEKKTAQVWVELNEREHKTCEGHRLVT